MTDFKWAAKDDAAELQSFIENIKISEDRRNRGWYIVDGSINGGTHYLYNDGIIRNGVIQGQGRLPDTVTAFWPTPEEAMMFVTTWLKDHGK